APGPSGGARDRPAGHRPLAGPLSHGQAPPGRPLALVRRDVGGRPAHGRGGRAGHARRAGGPGPPVPTARPDVVDRPAPAADRSAPPVGGELQRVAPRTGTGRSRGVRGVAGAVLGGGLTCGKTRNNMVTRGNCTETTRTLGGDLRS